ncbi:conserved hypothetical protein [Frankia sp. AiPs1]
MRSAISPKAFHVRASRSDHATTTRPAPSRDACGYPCLVRFIAGAEIDEARLAAICDRYGIAELQLFGSQARGTATADSDIDILYTLQPGRRLGWDIEQLADDLADLFGRPVDLVSVRGLHPLLRSSVLAEARPVYAA